MHHIANRLDIPLRRRYFARPEKDRLTAEKTRLESDIANIDQQLVDLWQARLTARTDLELIHDVLWPRVVYLHCPRPPAPDRSIIAPQSAQAAVVYGRALRHIALVILRRHGPQRLSDLHSLIHLYGYSVHGPNPVKVLADAMGTEADQGRARRVERGVYDVTASWRPSRRWTHPVISNRSIDIDSHGAPRALEPDPVRHWSPENWGHQPE